VSPLALLASVDGVSSWVSLAGGCVAVLAVLVGLGRVLQRLDDVRAEHAAARVESKAQHEETRREIAALREARVETAALIDHMRSDLDALKASHTSLVGLVEAKDRAQSDARHDQTNAIAAALRQMVSTELDAREAARAARARGRG